MTANVRLSTLIIIHINSPINSETELKGVKIDDEHFTFFSPPNQPQPFSPDLYYWSPLGITLTCVPSQVNQRKKTENFFFLISILTLANSPQTKANTPKRAVGCAVAVCTYKKNALYKYMSSPLDCLNKKCMSYQTHAQHKLVHMSIKKEIT